MWLRSHVIDAYKAGKSALGVGVNRTAGAAGAAYEAGKTAAEMGVNATTGVWVCARVRICAWPGCILCTSV